MFAQSMFLSSLVYIALVNTSVIIHCWHSAKVAVAALEREVTLFANSRKKSGDNIKKKTNGNRNGETGIVN